MFPDHAEHFNVYHNKPEKLPDKIGPYPPGETCRHRGIIIFFVGSSYVHGLTFYSGTTFQNGLAFAL